MSHKFNDDYDINNDRCGNCAYYWDSVNGKCCNCPESLHIGENMSEYDVCGEYLSCESWDYEYYAQMRDSAMKGRCDYV